MKLSINKLLFVFLISLTGFAQINTPAASPSTILSQTLGLTKITVDYSRPSVKGRKIFGDLVPYGKVWRTGANKITSIKFDDEVYINGASMKAGTYGLYTIPGKGEWTIIFNRDDKQWGAYGYDIKKDIIRFNVQPIQPEQFTEQMTIDFAEFTPTTAYLSIRWESSEVRFKIEQRGIDEKIMAEIAEKTSKPDASADTYFAAADFYCQKGIKLDQALEWANKVIEKDKEYWTYQLVARIAAKQNNCAVAIPNAEKSMELAKKAGDDAYIKLNQAVLSQCKKGY
jgi:tetratricopeptide (TPR) repeat protein